MAGRPRSRSFRAPRRLQGYRVDTMLWIEGVHMGLPSTADARSIRVAVPILASFATDSFTFREFTLNLSEGGIFLPCDRACPPGTQGTLKFRVTQFEAPFTLRAEVVHVITSDNDPGRPPGMGMRFIDVADEDLARLRRLVDGVRDGSVADAIRRTMREGKRTLIEELRRRPVDQKMILAVTARSEEILALIQDGNSSVLERVLKNPRIMPKHLVALLRDPRLTARLLRIVGRTRHWMADEEVRWHFCIHQNAALGEVQAHLPRVSLPRLEQLSENPRMRPQLRSAARETAKRKKHGQA